MKGLGWCEPWQCLGSLSPRYFRDAGQLNVRRVCEPEGVVRHTRQPSPNHAVLLSALSIDQWNVDVP